MRVFIKVVLYHMSLVYIDLQSLQTQNILFAQTESAAVYTDFVVLLLINLCDLHLPQYILFIYDEFQLKRRDHINAVFVYKILNANPHKLTLMYTDKIFLTFNSE